VHRLRLRREKLQEQLAKLAGRVVRPIGLPMLSARPSEAFGSMIIQVPSSAMAAMAARACAAAAPGSPMSCRQS
jgi:hypothetical protein